MAVHEDFRAYSSSLSFLGSFL